MCIFFGEDRKMKMKWVNGHRMKLILLGFVAALALNGGSAKADFTFGESTNLVVLLDTAMTCGLMAQVSFTRILDGDIAEDSGLLGGCAWGDYDNDGYPDLAVADEVGEFNHLYHNNGNGTFYLVTEGTIASDPGTSSAPAWGDYDNDGDLDLFVSNFDPPRDYFYRNEGDGHFTKVTQGAWVTDSSRGVGAAWGDYDNDGFLDLYVANSWGQNNFLYRNNGDGTMALITSGPPVTSGGNSHGCAWSDYDGDGDLDLFVVGGNGQNDQQFLNNADGSFTRVTTGHLVNSGGQGIGISCADYDNDGDLDLLVTGWGVNENRLYRNDGAVELTFMGSLEAVGAQSVNAAWGDYDNDGYLDLFIANYDRDNFLYHNNGDGTFARVTEGALVHDGGHSCGCAWADYDNDGDLDLFVANGVGMNTIGTPESGFLYRNDSGTNNWLLLRLVGVTSNRSAIGAKVRLRATIGGKTFWQLREVSGGAGYCSQNDLRVHFGLGDAATVESVRIEWPSGITQFLRDVPVNQLLTIEEEDATANNTATGITPGCPDFNGDEIVDGIDIDILLEHWQTDYLLCDIAPPPYGDGIVDVQDLVEVAEHLFEEILPPELIAYWKLDEAEGDIANNTVSDNNGLLSGSPAWQPEVGKIAGALELDGIDDYISADFVLDPSWGAFSVFAWIKGGAPEQTILSQVNGRNWLSIDEEIGALSTELTVGLILKPLVSQAVITDGDWHRVGVSWDGANLLLYVDDVEVARKTQSSIPGSQNGLYIGAGNKLGVDTFFSGLIDDVRIYNQALSDEEIAALAQ